MYTSFAVATSPGWGCLWFLFLRTMAAEGWQRSQRPESPARLATDSRKMRPHPKMAWVCPRFLGEPKKMVGFLGYAFPTSKRGTLKKEIHPHGWRRVRQVTRHMVSETRNRAPQNELVQLLAQNHPSKSSHTSKGNESKGVVIWIR